jgi:hypothetical protein
MVYVSIAAVGAVLLAIALWLARGTARRRRRLILATILLAVTLFAEWYCYEVRGGLPSYEDQELHIGVH